MNTYWEIPQEWDGGTAYIVGGGPTVASIDLNALAGQRIIAINSSVHVLPFASFCIFSDSRWWDHNKNKMENFKGRIVCLSRSVFVEGRLLLVQRRIPPALDHPDNCLGVQFTTATGAMELAVRLGAQRLILLGIDGKNAANGKSHHHKPHPWPAGAEWQKRHRADLQKMVAPLKRRGVDVMLGTPSAYEDLWPLIDMPPAKAA